MITYLKLEQKSASAEHRPLRVSGIYERDLACTYYNRLDAIYREKVAELRAQGKSKRMAEQLADQYVTITYCDGHSRKIYAVAQARKQLVREGLIPTNASVIQKLWDYDPYTRLCATYADSIIAQRAE